MNFASWYTRFRGSPAFLVGLSTFILMWLALHWLSGLDPDLGGINLFLSAEASVSLALFTMIAEQHQIAQAKQEAVQRQMMEQQLHLLEAMHALLQQQIKDSDRCG